MSILRIQSAVEQVAAHLRVEIAHGTYDESLPGVTRLAADLGVNHKTVQAALENLEEEGLLIAQGPRRKRLVATSENKRPRPMRLGILLYGPSDRELAFFVEIQHALMDAGHTVTYAGKTLTELGMDLRRVARLVRSCKVDAWIVVAGSRSILEWFDSQPQPVFALFGRRASIPIASTGPSTDQAITDAVTYLVGKGHRRIINICRSERRKPNPGKTERAFLASLASHGISTGDYNLPDWEESQSGLQDLLLSLFRVTPPTALIVEESFYFITILQFLASHGFQVPRDVSLICFEHDPQFRWCEPSVAHLKWEQAPAIRRILRWASKVSHKKIDRQMSWIPAKFVPGGTIGPVPATERTLLRKT